MTVYLTTGTIAVTNGSAAVTGTDTDWATALVTSGVLYVDGGAYPIASVASDTALTLALPYAGATGSGLAYAIGRSEAIQDQTVINAAKIAELLGILPTFSAYSKTLFDDADASSVLSTLGFSAFGKTMIDDPDAAAARTTLGAQAALGFTPVNRAGDTMTGNLGIGDGVDRTPGSGTNHLRVLGSGYNGHITMGSAGMWIGHGSFARDLIFDIGNIEVARIETGGRLLVANTPIFQVVHFGATALTTGSTMIGMAGNGTVSIGINNGGHFSTVFGRFTAPVAGKYVFLATATPGESSSGPALAFSKNGIGVGTSMYMYSSQYSASANVTLQNLSAGDYVNAEFQHLNGVASSLYTGLFAGFLVN